MVKVFLDNKKQSRYNILMKKFKRCNIKKFNIIKWKEDRKKQYKKDSDMIWFMLKHPLTWLMGMMVAMMILELLK